MTTILVVDDELPIREALVLSLKEEGYHVLAAANGEQALALLNPSAVPMIILLDRMMPVLSGDYLLLALAASSTLCQRHRIIVMTAHRSGISEMVKHAMQKLDALLVTKPFDLYALLRLINHVARLMPQEHLTNSNQQQENL